MRPCSATDRGVGLLLGDEWELKFEWPTSPSARRALMLWLADHLSEVVQLACLKCETEGCTLTPRQEALLLSAGAMLLRMERTAPPVIAALPPRQPRRQPAPTYERGAGHSIRSREGVEVDASQRLHCARRRSGRSRDGEGPGPLRLRVATPTATRALRRIFKFGRSHKATTLEHVGRCVLLCERVGDEGLKAATAGLLDECADDRCCYPASLASRATA
jgi:hypothetical protein